ncbi:hypothetical protein DRQ07_05195, partial [candidate division KSB1 bacterium]
MLIFSTSSFILNRKGFTLRAQSLSVCIPYNGCNKNCPYCISKITGINKSDFSLMIDNLPKVKNLAQAAQVSTILFTGKGEPFMNYADVLFFLKNFREYWTEIQTNGIWLENNIEKL